jgi:hypothetical protein
MSGKRGNGTVYDQDGRYVIDHSKRAAEHSCLSRPPAFLNTEH